MKKMLLTICLVVNCSVAFPHSGPEVPEPLPLETLAAAFGWDLMAQRLQSNELARI